MTTIHSLLKEFDEEVQTTRKMLSIVPTDHFGWKPHSKSMTIQQLATHVAEIPSWIKQALTESGLNFSANPYEPKAIANNEELLEFFEESAAIGRKYLEAATDNDLLPDWTLRNGDFIISVRSKREVVRMCFSQVVHHRAQLGVYLRLLNIAIPGSYGPSADEMELQQDYVAG